MVDNNSYQYEVIGHNEIPLRGFTNGIVPAVFLMMLNNIAYIVKTFSQMLLLQASADFYQYAHEDRSRQSPRW